MKLNFLLTITDEDTQETLWTVDTFSAERVEEELGKFERWLPRRISHEAMAALLNEEEPELTRAEADERERSSHIHP